ncbi:MAG: HNH endonuclease [Bacilli bacterium]
MPICALCERDVPQLTAHHLLPRSHGGGPEHVANLCVTCHTGIHQRYSNDELAARLHSIPLLKDDPEIARFLKFVRKQPSGKMIRSKRAKSNPRKR